MHTMHNFYCVGIDDYTIIIAWQIIIMVSTGTEPLNGNNLVLKYYVDKHSWSMS